MSSREWVTLLSDDGYKFIIDREWAMLSGTIRTMLSTDDGGFSEAESGICTLQIRGQVLEKVVEYLQWHARYSHQSQYPIKEFESKIPPELALELLMAADFLEL
ncbi:transcription elongation factor B, polypeptide 1 [Malassezia restricta]|uniref:Elongin-C n=1 Tax=Malassezia restricta (strain ATCC 96810 / NBRC 103918 / CBS 7877) TaxID=425264 RepID=A0A3G2S441_MALR7|nr:transcription elongation factor B, polypeptide 1 [Malassezia restricta]AXA49446.1 transcription elongation factor B, polypeptide 1 [Malassezia restricta]AYO42159.1 Elongin-C [Malassezia restricta CBS 7877]